MLARCFPYCFLMVRMSMLTELDRMSDAYCI